MLVAYRTVDGFMTDWAVNISKGGLFVNTRTPLDVGAEVKLILQLPDGNASFDLMGRVNWVNPAGGEGNAAPGMGIEFLDVSAETRERLEAFVQKLNASFAGTPKP